MTPGLLVPLTIFLPAAGALVLWIEQRWTDDTRRKVATAVAAGTFVLTLFLLNRFDSASPDVQFGVAVPWISAWNVNFRVGVDGVSLPLVILTSFISLMALLASGCVKEQVRGYLVLFLLLETSMLGVFCALDFFLFYVFYELMLLPMFFLIGLWGGPRREYAAIKFFLYTLVGGVAILVALLVVYFGGGGERTFDLPRLAQIGQGLVPGSSLGPTLQVIAFSLLLFGFGVKIPIVPFHTWLPDAHTEAPTPISMILAGVLLKTGAYGLVRIAFPVCPWGAQALAWPMMLIGVTSILYGALAALAQSDFKRLVAYSSVSHMGYVLIGLAAWKLGDAGQTIGSDYWKMGIGGALFQMVAHGITSAAMFFLVGVLYDRVHHRDLRQFGGILGKLPDYGGLSMGLFFAAMGLPGLCGFWGEVFPLFGAWNFDPSLAVAAGLGVVLTAGYILWTIQRVYLGPTYRGPDGEGLVPLTGTEAGIGYTFMALAIALGVMPDLLFGLMRASVADLVARMSAAGEMFSKLVAGG